jgi:hypothetical protein
VIFTWDGRKAAANLKKHGVDFREAATIFHDPLSTTFPDEDHSEFEHRFFDRWRVRSKARSGRGAPGRGTYNSNYQRQTCDWSGAKVL